MPVLFCRASTANPLIKPDGSPTMISNSLSSGMLLYMFDTGTGLYSLVKDCTPTHLIDPPNYYNGVSPSYDPSAQPNDPKQSLAVPASTPYGNAIAWPGSAQDSARPGGGCLVQLAGSSAGTGDDLRTAINMIARTTGEGFTMFATHRQTGTTTGGLICGRGCDLDNSGDICAIRVDSGGVGGSATNVSFGWSYQADNSHHASISSIDPCGTGLCTTVVSMINTAPGVTDITMYVNGVIQAQATGTTVCDVSAGSASNEDQFQVGSYFHVYAGQWFNTFNGNVYQCGMANRAWTQAEALSFANSPYQLLSF